MTRVFLVVLLLAAGAVAWFVLRPDDSTIAVEDSTGSAPTRATEDAGSRPVGLARAPREGIVDDAEVLKVPDGVPERSRILISDVSDDGTVTGERIRAALLEAPGLFLRWESEAAKEAFLAAKIRVPAPAYMPREHPIGAPVGVVIAAVREAGFKATFAAPRVVIGAKP